MSAIRRPNSETKLLRATPETVHWGYLDAAIPPVLTISSGERVWIWNGQWRRAFGTAAEAITLPSEQAVALPANVGMEAGACLGIPAYTAYQSVVLTGAAEGSTVLVAGGAGAVGRRPGGEGRRVPAPGDPVVDPGRRRALHDGRGEVQHHVLPNVCP